MKNFEAGQSRRDCMAFYGNMEQLAGVKRYTFSEGKAAGMTGCDVDTGGGLSFTVLPGRGMDIASLRYRGVPIAYLSKTGLTAPSYHDPREMQWLKSFFGGMVTTCGLTNAGPPCRDEVPVLGSIPFGLHGDISNTAADQVCTGAAWQPDGRYRLSVSGRVSEGRLHGEHLELRREVIAFLGEKRLFLFDTFENAGDTPQPLMFFYHINIGHPVLAEGSAFWAPSRRIWAETEASKAGQEDHARCEAPRAEALEQQFFHALWTDDEGFTTLALVNEELELGVYLRYALAELPKLAQWKLQRYGEYVFAFEPGNCHPIGREKAREEGTLEWLRPLSSRTAHLEIGILDGAEEIAAARETIRRMKRVKEGT